jgi:predicted  nucleic acid-binding Zn-ribbon protein
VQKPETNPQITYLHKQLNQSKKEITDLKRKMMRMEERNRDLEGDADEETDKKTKVFKAGFIIS